MSLPFVDLLRYNKRQREAAKQMWNYVRQGMSFEIPVSLSTDDDTMKALECMCRQHPEVVMGQRGTNGGEGAPLTLQSRGIVVGLRQNIAASPEALKVLKTFGYQPDAKGGLVELFDAHAAFIKNRGRMDPAEAVEQAQMDAKARNAIVLTDQREERAKDDAKPSPEQTVVSAPSSETSLASAAPLGGDVAHADSLHLHDANK